MKIELYTFQEVADEGIPNFFENQTEILESLKMTSADCFGYFQTLYKNRYTIYSAVQIGTVADYIFKENEYKYRTLAKTLNLIYDPIENYSMHEKEIGTRIDDFEHTTSRGTLDTTTNNLQSSTLYGQQIATDHSSNSTVKNNQTQTSTITNNQTRTETRTPHELKNTHSVAPYDATDIKTEYTDTQTGSETNTLAFSGNGDTEQVSYSGDADLTTNTGTDTTKNSGTDTITNTGTQSIAHSGEDTLTDNGTQQTERELTRSGNIGVTTSQQMIESERGIAAFNLLQVIFADLCEKLFVSEIY